MDEQSSRQDLLSELPLGIIHIILSFVPIRDAIRTSLLAKQWRYIWTSLPYLVFDEECVNPPMETERDEKRLIDFISQALHLHNGPIYKFQLYLPAVDMSRLQLQSINQWLHLLSMNGVRVLVFEFEDTYNGIEILSSLYSCHNLTLLKLYMDTIPPPLASFKGFLFLRSLDIFSSNVDSTTIETIVAHSPLLEELTLVGCSELTIRAANLKFFCFGFRSTHLSLCTPLLEELIINFMHIKHFSFHKSSMFHHLRIIKLSFVAFDREEVIILVDRLIKHSPNLQKLEISSLTSYRDGVPELAFWDAESAPDFTCDSLKVIKMAIYGCGIDGLNEVKLLKFLLARSPVLDRVIYKLGAPLSEQVLLNLTAELRGCRRASANAEIVIDEMAEMPLG